MVDRIAAAFVPLLDCAVLVVAREQGFAEAEGLDLALVKEPSWASLRDHLNLGHVDCAHALAPLPIASTLGVGHVQVDCIVPFVLGRGGNAVTVSTQLHSEMEEAARGAPLDAPAAAGKALAEVIKKRAAPPTLGMVFPFSSHNFDLRYWLAAFGVHPDRDVRLVAIPPPLMVESLRAGHVDGFCVGEPWNSLAVADGLGRIVATKSQLMPHGAEKVLAVRAALGAQDELLGKLLRALAAAAAWADAPANRAALARLLARPEYVGSPAEMLEAALSGKVALGGGRTADDPSFIFFHRDAANVPRTEDALWNYAQMVRWGQLRPSAAAQAAAAGVFRADLWRRHVGEAPSAPSAPLPFDGVPFDADDVAAYLERFEVCTRYVASPGAEL
jgi:ABC-type nitrate/sulfonate/bicarbonate transport system substrate-binding protein